jgi:hypothetical protein
MGWQDGLPTKIRADMHTRARIGPQQSPQSHARACGHRAARAQAWSASRSTGAPAPRCISRGRIPPASACPQLTHGSRDEGATQIALQQQGDPTCRRARSRGMCEHGIMLGMSSCASGQQGEHLRARNRRLHGQKADQSPPLWHCSGGERQRPPTMTTLGTCCCRTPWSRRTPIGFVCSAECPLHTNVRHPARRGRTPA